MAKALFIAEKPSVAKEFAKALKLKTKNYNGYMESEDAVVTWCVGHLITMSYPDAYDPKYKRWSFDTLPFLPSEYKYEVIPSAAKQYEIVRSLLNRQDIDTIYVCTDSGREGEYIYRLVEQKAHVSGKRRRRVWIDSQTEEEILRGVEEAKDLSEYDHLADAAYLRAKEDYLMGINFSRALTLKYGDAVSGFLRSKYTPLSVGRVMTCVLGMVVRREREIRNFVKTPFYRLILTAQLKEQTFEGEWRVQERSAYYGSKELYKENGFLKREDAEALREKLSVPEPVSGQVLSLEKKKEKKNAPLLYNLAELQNDCSRFFKISPDETLKIAQELYEKKLTTYPRTDARVLSTAVAKEIQKNIGGLKNYTPVREFAAEVLEQGLYRKMAKTRYVNDKQITDHYAIIPTGQGGNAFGSLNGTAKKVYEMIARRFLAVFYPPAVYQKVSLVLGIREEQFYSTFKILEDPGFQKVMRYSFTGPSGSGSGPGESAEERSREGQAENAGEPEEREDSQRQAGLMQAVRRLKKGDVLPVKELSVKEGETSPPKRYSSGSMILAMENAGQLIESDELREQIKGSGIGTSATRAEILKKLVHICYLSLNAKTQVITPTHLGEMIFDVVEHSIRPMLNPELTASWEKGLTQVAQGVITSGEYMEKLNNYVARRTNAVRGLNNQYEMRKLFEKTASYYKKETRARKKNTLSGAVKGTAEEENREKNLSKQE